MVNRRHFIKQFGAFSVAFSGFGNALANTSTINHLLDQKYKKGYGPLIKDPKGILDLPKGFSYSVFSKYNEKMDDGLLVPAAHDGMAVFNGSNGNLIIIRNHELGGESHLRGGPFGPNLELLSKADKRFIYDLGNNGIPAQGGTTTIIYDPIRKKVVRQFLSLAGTMINCCGGPTPWQSWISCEETETQAGEEWKKDHGYNFEVPVSETPKLTKPVPLKSMGRFSHEAVAIDPDTGIAYQTEDEGNGLIYRFIPNMNGKFHKGGVLQALCFKSKYSMDTRNWSESNIELKKSYDVEWVTLNDVESPENDLRLRGAKNGAAIFARGEGMWFDNGKIYFTCTSGGKKKLGQLYVYTPSTYEGSRNENDDPGKLELLVEPVDSEIMDMCDNITVAPWGDMIICEDGKGTDYLLGIHPDGTIYKLAKNALNDKEFAGGVFSPDGSILFVNIQLPGMTLAITGPWQG
tara:strand:+ start:647 stop:2032 length:1386 start_codon:yes stop_codon:yes gene_type:complete